MTVVRQPVHGEGRRATIHEIVDELGALRAEIALEVSLVRRGVDILERLRRRFMRCQIAGRFPGESRTGIECAELLHFLRRQWTVLGNGSVENDGGAAAKGTGRPAVGAQLDQTGLALIERANGAFKRRRARLERGEEIATERHDRFVEPAFAPVERQRNIGVNLLSQFDELRVDIFHALQRCLKLRVFKR